MDFRLSRSQTEIQKAARDFAKGEFDKDLARALDKQGAFPEAIWKKAADLGFIGTHFEERFSGGGLSAMENAIIAEAFCRNDPGIGAALMLSGHGAECLLRFGENGLKQRFLPAIAEGKAGSAAAFYEPETGFDLMATQSQAQRRETHWVINGTKAHVANGDRAHFFVVLCQSDPDAAPRRALSLFLVEANQTGVSVEAMGEKLGSRMVAATLLRLDDVCVPETHIIGSQGKGLDYAEAFFAENRVLCAAMALGTAQGAYDRAMDYVKHREQFGRKIIQFEVTRHKLADMALKIELARLVTYQAAWQFETGSPDPRLSIMAGLYAGQAAVEVTDEAVQLLGGYGYMAEYDIERFYRDAKTLSLFAHPRGAEKSRLADALIGRIRS
jgi:alkylation response protein AidB-like acyl-CoA dehydrogenase